MILRDKGSQNLQSGLDLFPAYRICLTFINSILSFRFTSGFVVQGNSYFGNFTFTFNYSQWRRVSSQSHTLNVVQTLADWNHFYDDPIWISKRWSSPILVVLVGLYRQKPVHI